MLERLADIGAKPEDSHDERLRAGALILASVGIGLISFVWVITYLAFDEPLAAAIPATFQVVTLVGLVVLARTKRFDIFRTTQLTCFLLLPALLQVALGGFAASSGMILWAVMSPLAALAMLGVRRSLPWLVAFFLVLAVLTVLDPALVDGDPAELPERLVIAFFVLNISGMTLGAFLMLGYFVHQRERAHAALEVERERSERLLLNVLPEPIAERLKRHEGVIAEQLRRGDRALRRHRRVHASCRPTCSPGCARRTCSTRSSPRSTRSPTQHGLEKIKTIGDAYMVVGGRAVAAGRPRARRSREMALEMRDAVARSRAAAGTSSRSGSASTRARSSPGVIGRQKFIYDLWGDTVNTASRMESHGVPGRGPGDRTGGYERLEGGVRARAPRADRGEGQGADADLPAQGRDSVG